MSLALRGRVVTAGALEEGGVVSELDSLYLSEDPQERGFKNLS